MAMSRSLGGRSLTTRSPIAISPAVISSSPATMRRVVVLPQPEGPTRTMNSLSRIVRLTSLTACTSSYFLFRSLSTTCAMGDLAVPVIFDDGLRDDRRAFTLGAGYYHIAASRIRPRAERVHPVPRGAGPGGPPYPDLTLHGAGEPRHVVLHEERVNEGHGDRAQESPGHELAPEVDVAADQLRDHPDRHRLFLGRGEEDEGVDELVPGQGEREDARGEDAGDGDRKDDPDHGPETGGSVDARALLEFLGDGLEVAHEEPGGEGDEERRIGQDESPRRVAQLEGADDVGERDEQERRRHEIGDEDRSSDSAGEGELEAAQGIAGEQSTKERDGGGETGDEERVPQPVGKRGLGEQVPEVLQRRVHRPERRVVGGAPRAVELGIGSNGRDQHPVEGEEGPDHEEGERNVEVDPLLPPPLDDQG